MVSRTRYGIIVLGILTVLVLVYLRLTILKVDSQQEPAPTHETKSLSKGIESFAVRHTRNLNDHESRTLGIELKPFATQNFWIIVETGLYAPESEQMKFGQQLRSALLSAGWIESQFILQRMGAAGFKRTKMASYSRGGDSGVVVRADNSSTPAGRRLNMMLNELSIRSSFEPDDTMKNAMLIFVGDQ